MADAITNETVAVAATEVGSALDRMIENEVGQAERTITIPRFESNFTVSTTGSIDYARPPEPRDPMRGEGNTNPELKGIFENHLREAWDNARHGGSWAISAPNTTLYFERWDIYSQPQPGVSWGISGAPAGDTNNIAVTWEELYDKWLRANEEIPEPKTLKKPDLPPEEMEIYEYIHQMAGEFGHDKHDEWDVNVDQFKAHGKYITHRPTLNKLIKEFAKDPVFIDAEEREARKHIERWIDNRTYRLIDDIQRNVDRTKSDFEKTFNNFRIAQREYSLALESAEFRSKKTLEDSLKRAILKNQYWNFSRVESCGTLFFRSKKPFILRYKNSRQGIDCKINFGQFDIQIDAHFRPQVYFVDGTADPKLEKLREDGWRGIREYPHPHVCKNTICFGEEKTMYMDYVRRGYIDSILNLSYKCLANYYHDNPHLDMGAYVEAMNDVELEGGNDGL